MKNLCESIEVYFGILFNYFDASAVEGVKKTNTKSSRVLLLDPRPLHSNHSHIRYFMFKRNKQYIFNTSSLTVTLYILVGSL